MEDHTRGVAECAIGVDLGDREAQFCVVDRHGKAVERGRVSMTERAVRKAFEERGLTRIAIEVGTHSPWVSRLIEDLGHQSIVANPRQIPLTYRHHKKTIGWTPSYLLGWRTFDLVTPWCGHGPTW